MAFLTDEDRKRIEAAVAAAERRTAAEFVTVIARASGNYRFLPTLLAAVGMLLLSGVALVIPWPFTLTVAELYLGQVVVFVGLFLLLRWRPVLRRLVPKGAQHARARLKAHQLFLDLGLASTREHTGVLFFVSVAEHYAEIITDRGVRAVVDDAEWSQALAAFTAKVRAGRVADGFLGAIDACTAVLAEKLPPRADDRNELPNRLIEL